MTTLPEGSAWLYEIKLDGYRALAINSKGNLSLVSRNRKSFNRQYPYIVEALTDLPENTMVDGEVVALDDAGKPNFNLLQHSRSQASRICYFIFDVLVYHSHDLTHLPLIERREIMGTVDPKSREPTCWETEASSSADSCKQGDPPRRGDEFGVAELAFHGHVRTLLRHTTRRRKREAAPKCQGLLSWRVPAKREEPRPIQERK